MGVCSLASCGRVALRAEGVILREHDRPQLRCVGLGPDMDRRPAKRIVQAVSSMFKGMWIRHQLTLGWLAAAVFQSRRLPITAIGRAGHSSKVWPPAL